MQILNFAHPLSDGQLAEIETITAVKITDVIDICSQIEPHQAIEPQIETMLDGTGLTSKEWQTKPLLINLPSLNYSAVALLVQLHGRAGYFLPVLRLRPNTEGVAPSFQVSEILNLQAMRERARGNR